MKKFLSFAIVASLAAVACKKDKAEEKPATASTDTKPAIDAAAVADVAAKVTDAAAAVACTLDGNYRFRFASNGTAGWWFRFSAKDGKATLSEEVSVLGLEPGPIVFTAKPEACQFTIAIRTTKKEEISVALTLDSKANTVSGTLEREMAFDPKDKKVEVTGVRDEGEPKSASSCVVPGLYKLEFDPKFEWKNSDEEDDRDCSRASVFASPMVLKLEPYGESLALTLREPDAPYDSAWPSDVLTRTSDCEVRLQLSDETTTLDSKLVLSADGITGRATKVTHQIVEDGEDGENIWDCVGENVPVTAIRIP
jgi:hypothetical protein